MVVTDPTSDGAGTGSNPKAEVAIGDDKPITLNNLSVKNSLCTDISAAKDAIVEEFRNLFITSEAPEHTKRSSITQEKKGKLLRSHMFQKEKHDGKGKFEKIKSCLVGDQSVSC